MRMVVALILALEVISALGLAHVSGSVSSGLLMTLRLRVWTFIRSGCAAKHLLLQGSWSDCFGSLLECCYTRWPTVCSRAVVV